MAKIAADESLRRAVLPGRPGVVDLAWAKYVGWFWLAWLANLLASGPLLLSLASGDRSAMTGLPLDDAWVRMVYVRSLVTQGCLCYNDGAWEAGATSWGWVLANAPFYLVGHVWLGFDEAYVVKFVGLTFAALATVFLFALMKRLTGRRWAALAVSGIVVAEPAFAYHRVAGMEGPLIVAAVLGATLALLADRRTLGGLALLAAFWSRPEAALFVTVALAGVSLRWAAQNGALAREAFGELVLVPFSKDVGNQWVKARAGLTKLYGERSMLWMFGPPLLGGLAWIAYNLLVNGTIYPNTYLAKHDPTLGIFPLANISNVYHWGIAYWQPWLAGWLLPITAFAYVLGAGTALRRGGLVLIPLLLFPLLTVYGVGISARYGEAPMTFWTRRYVDIAFPIIVAIASLGGYALATTITRNAYREFSGPRARVAFLAPLYGLFLAAAVGSLIGGVGTWRTVIHDYSWNARNIEEVDVAAGKWITENTEPAARVLVFDAGAIRYFGNRYTYDVVGLNSHELIGRDHVDAVITEKPEVLAIWTLPVYEQMPNAVKHAEFVADPNTILGSDRIGVFSLNWDPALFASPDEIRLVDVEGEVIDAIDITDRMSEEAHDYFISFVSYAPRAVGELGGLAVIDRGVSHSGEVVERFRLSALPGRALTLVLRHQTTGAEVVPPEVLVDGRPAGVLPVEASSVTFQETALAIPAELVTSDEVEITVRWQMSTTEFRWWAVAGP